MLGWLFSVAIEIAMLWALIWALNSIAELKRGQARILDKLAGLEASQNRPMSTALPNEAAQPTAPQQG